MEIIKKTQYEKVTKNVDNSHDARTRRIRWMEARGWQYFGFDMNLNPKYEPSKKILLHFRRIKSA